MSSSKPEYAELHCHSNFSFLDGASHPEELVAEAVRLGLNGLAVTDHDGFYGVVRFATAAREQGLPTIFGAELTIAEDAGASREDAGAGKPAPGSAGSRPAPAESHLLLLANGQSGYHGMAQVIGEAHLAGCEKGRPVYQLEQIAAQLRGTVTVLTGCRKGHVPAAMARGGTRAAAEQLDRLVTLFGSDNVAVELVDSAQPDDLDRLDAMAELAESAGLPVVATNNVHYHQPARRQLATVTAAVRARSSLDAMEPYLPAAATAHLRSPAEMAQRMRWYPTAVPYAAELARRCAFDLKLIAPRLPDYDVPAGHTETTWLRELTYRGAEERYGPRPAHPEAYRQLDRELAMVEQLGFPGYFLIVYDIVAFCRSNGIYCQGRGSAANSAVCYALRITNVDAVAHQLLFERFLSPERQSPPDIDVDIESGRREEVIQYVYRKYGRRHTALVANVISYRPRSAVRDVARAFGHAPGQQDAWSKSIDRWRDLDAVGQTDIPQQVLRYAKELLTAPRHLGIHPGGMVICDRPVTEVCPVEWARMPGRSVLQWDKDDCAEVGLVKFDLLGLGMLSALHLAHDMLDEPLDLGDLHCDDPEIYDMLCRADTIGVFQVESRAQMATLPRLKPRCFYDLAVEIALIRPGPIQGSSVHPYIRRKNGLEEPVYPHPLMRNALEKTLGVPLFQEQMMQLAIDMAGFSAAEADQLRHAMGAKRSAERMARMKDRLYSGMAERGIAAEIAEDVYHKLEGFAAYGFPESHAMSFAYLVYASAWLKRYHPAAFCAALLNAQPMGFYPPQTLVDDARRHGVPVNRPDINASGAKAVLEPAAAPGAGFSPGFACGAAEWGNGPGEPPSRWGSGGPAVRLGLDQVRTIGPQVAERIVTARQVGGPYRDMPDLARRAGLNTANLEALATAGAFDCFGIDRRTALWSAGAAARDTPGHLPETLVGMEAPTLPGMSDVDLLMADVWATGMSADAHPIGLIRTRLTADGVLPISALASVEDGRRVLVAGMVTHRQRPPAARGVTFVNLSDETGLLNVVCSAPLWTRYRTVARSSAALLVRGRIQSRSGAISLVADQLRALATAVRPASRDFR